MGQWVLSLDVGTSSVRCAAYDVRGRQLPFGVTSRSQTPKSGVGGEVTYGADELVERVAEVLDEGLSRVPAEALRSGPVGVAVTTFWHSLVGVDVAGRAVTDVWLWRDGRSHAQAAALRERLDEREVHARTGCVLHATYAPARLRWFAQERPEVCARVWRWMTFAEYLCGRLFGFESARMSVSMASGTGLFDQHRCDWDDEVLAASGIDRGLLPPIAEDGFAARGLLAPWRTRWPALAEVPWLPAVGDGAASSVGAGCTTRERAALMVGTSVALRVLFRDDHDTAAGAERLQIPWGVWGYRLDRRRVLLGGALNDGGGLFAWLRATLQLPDAEALERALAAAPADGHGLTVLPHWGGERSPGWASDARGAIIGLGHHTTPVDLARAALEAVALRCAEVDARLREALPGPLQVVATGGAFTRSKAWLQIFADVLGTPLMTSAETEASCRGAALVALEQWGLLRSPDGASGAALEDAPAREGSRFEPDPERHERLKRAGARQRALYAALHGDASTGPRTAPGEG